MYLGRDRERDAEKERNGGGREEIRIPTWDSFHYSQPASNLFSGAYFVGPACSRLRAGIRVIRTKTARAGRDVIIICKADSLLSKRNRRRALQRA